MDIAFMIVCAVFVIGFLVLIHEGGHFLAARAFGVRVTEFMLGLPGPSVGFRKGETRFGVTAVPLGGYAKICGMDCGPESPYLEEVATYIYSCGTADVETVANACGIDEDDAEEALDQLCEWGTISTKFKAGTQLYMTPPVTPTRTQKRMAKRLCAALPQKTSAGCARPIEDGMRFMDTERRQLYRNLPFWKRSIILLAGIAVNLAFAILAFILVYSVIGVDVMHPDTEELVHMTIPPDRAIFAGFNFIGMTVQAILGLFNPATAVETVSNSTSVVGIAVMSADYFAAGVAEALFFMALISISLGLMNLIPIPPLDGGRFLIEIIQKVSRRQVPTRVIGYLSVAGMALFVGFFVIMLNQDIQRFILGA